MKSLLLYTLLLICFPGLSQDYSYINYDTREGLAGSVVYHICQDKKGYVWFATDNGLSRFDGKTFKNFTTRDGLTDNEILVISKDSKDRIWIMPYNKKICYYYDGKIYNSDNDSGLSDIRHIPARVTGTENTKGEPYLQGHDGVYIYQNNGRVRRIADYKKIADKYSLNPSEFDGFYRNRQWPYGLLLYNREFFFAEINDSFQLVNKVEAGYPPIYDIKKDFELVFYKRWPPGRYTSLTIIDTNFTLFTTQEGAWLMDKDDIADSKPFLPGKRVSNALRDSEGNFWFSTLGEGVFRVSSTSVKNFQPGKEFLCLEKQDGKIYAGMSNGSLQIIEGITPREYRAEKRKDKNASPLRLSTMKSDHSGNVYLGFDSHLIKYGRHKSLVSPLFPIKSIDIIDDNHIVVCTNFCTQKLRSNDLSIADTIWKDRGTKVVYDKGLYYIGTLNGLIIIDTNKNRIDTDGNKALLGKRIVDLCKTENGSLWVATNDNGVLAYKNGKVEAIINMDNGLNSNICRSLFSKGNYLWVGSNKGINKIDAVAQKVIKSYTTAHLPSDIITDIYENNDTVWICTPVGLSFFDERTIQDSSICNLDMHVSVSGKPVPFSSAINLGWHDNNISFDYTAISFKSAGEITYKYRLTNLDTAWNTTALANISYPSLPPGDYEFSLYAVNKLGKKSDTARIKFSIATPFWKTIWFWVVMAVAVFLLLWYLLNSRYKTLQRKEKEKNQLAARITELEQLSLRAQINPHFIFNCLTSIQSFILNNDMVAANRYIGEFGSLMRQTLDNSSQPVIPISREINYMESYLKLEQMRFPSKFRYEINIDKNIQADQLFVPSLFLQPFAENSIRHGIRHKRELNGFVKINIEQAGDHIIFSIEDNGVGREVASQYKTVRHIEYQSKGIRLTLDRLNILSGENKEKIGFHITDLTDKVGKPTGTKVTIDFPISIITKLSER